MSTFSPLQQLHDCRRLPQMEPRRTYNRRQQKRKLLLLLLLPLLFSRKGSPSDEDGTSTTSSLLPMVYPARKISATRSSFGMPKFVCDGGKGSRRRKCMSYSSELFIAQEILHVLEPNGTLVLWLYTGKFCSFSIFKELQHFLSLTTTTFVLILLLYDPQCRIP
jgi:hypothetical protein